MAGQLGFAQAFIDPRLGANERLARIHALIDWAPLQVLASLTVFNLKRAVRLLDLCPG